MSQDEARSSAAGAAVLEPMAEDKENQRPLDSQTKVIQPSKVKFDKFKEEVK